MNPKSRTPEGPKASEESAEIRLTGTAVEARSVSAEVLVQTIEGIQQLAFIFGAAQDKVEINQRFKPSAELRAKYTLKCGIPAQGSYVMPMMMPLPGDAVGQQGVLQNVYQLLDSVKNESREELQRLLPDTVLRSRALTYLRQFLPKTGEAWELGFSSGGKSVQANSSFSETVSTWIKKAVDDNATMTVKGELVRIDFQANRIVIRYRPTEKELFCIYLPEVEEVLLKSRRDLIEVTGQFTLDSHGQPKKLTDVFRIEPVDLAPFQLSQVTWNDRIFRFSTPLVLTPSLDEDTQQLYVIQDSSLGIHVYAETREHLIQELSEQIAFLWDAYAVESDETLAPDALGVASNLRSRISV